jgi:hypothetical protein
MSCFSADVRGGDEKHCIKSHNHNTGDMTSLMHTFPPKTRITKKYDWLLYAEEDRCQE